MGYPNAYCVKCGEHTNTLEKHTVMLGSGTRALKGLCGSCSNHVYKFLPKDKDYSSEAKADQSGEMKFPKAYCVKCKDHINAKKPEVVFLHNGSRAMRGECPKCDSDVYRILGKKKLPTKKTEINGTEISYSADRKVISIVRRANIQDRRKTEIKSSTAKSKRHSLGLYIAGTFICAAIIAGVALYVL